MESNKAPTLIRHFRLLLERKSMNHYIRLYIGLKKVKTKKKKELGTDI